MSDEIKGTEVPEQTKALEVAQLSKEQPSDLKKIAVDIAPGVSVELDVDTAKKVIAHRDSRTKGFKELETKLKSAEDAAKNEASRAQLLEAMKRIKEKSSLNFIFLSVVDIIGMKNISMVLD
jgi:hypothetical protein